VTPERGLSFLSDFPAMGIRGQGNNFIINIGSTEPLFPVKLESFSLKIFSIKFPTMNEIMN
jgi:hypothetical protein